MPEAPRSSFAARRLDGRWVFVVLWLATTASLQWSVVRFRVLIVLVLTTAALALVWSLWRRIWPNPFAVGQSGTNRYAARPTSRLSPPIALLAGSVVVTLTVPLFSYLRGGWRSAALVIVAVMGLVGTLVLARASLRDRLGTSGPPLAAVAISGHLALAGTVILGDQAPRIDVWVMLQQSSDLLGRGENFFTAVWTGSPGVKDLYTYLPWMTVLLAPGRWIAGDVRWALALWFVVLLAALWLLGRALGSTGSWVTVGAVMVALAVVPGTITQIDQAWTEPVLAALLVLWALLVARGHPSWAIVPLALACASKQHLALVVPLLALWQAFGWRRILATGALTGALIAPWVVASPSAFVHDTVTSLISFHPIRFANTWFLLFLNEFGIALPFWVTGIVVLGAVAVACVAVRRRQPDLAELLRWIALVLLIANLVNKQAFYNQFWLSAALVLASCVAASPDEGSDRARRDGVQVNAARGPAAEPPTPG